MVQCTIACQASHVEYFGLVSQLDERPTCANNVPMTEQVDFAKEPELTLGWRIQMALDTGGLKHSDLMSKFEVSRGTVSRWCRDISPAPKKFILNEIAVMCGVSPRWLIDGPTKDGGSGPDGGDRGGQPVVLPLTLRRTAPSSTRSLQRAG